MDDLYAELGVPKTATADEIKKAYREAAFKYHPDRNPGNTAAEEKFKRVNAAYAVLGDSVQRKQYDLYGTTDSANSGGYSQHGSGYDPFWDMFGNRNANYGNRQQNTYNWSNMQNEEYKSDRKETFSSFLKYVISLLLGLYFFRISFIFFPIGPILSIVAFSSGISGILRSVKQLFTEKPKANNKTE